MTVIVTSPVYGKDVGELYSGPEEAWLVANGYAKNANTLDQATPGTDIAYASAFAVDPDSDNQIDYTGTLKADGLVHLAAPAGVVAPAVLPSDDLVLAANREADQQWPAYVAPDEGFANDGTHLGGTADNVEVDENYDFDAGGVNDDAPTIDAIEPAEGPAAGSTDVVITGRNFTDSTGVTFGGVDGTAFSVVDDSTINVTTPAGAAGAVDVVVTNATGSDTLTGGFTYTA